MINDKESNKDDLGYEKSMEYKIDAGRENYSGDEYVSYIQKLFPNGNWIKYYSNGAEKRFYFDGEIEYVNISPDNIKSESKRGKMIINGHEFNNL